MVLLEKLGADERNRACGVETTKFDTPEPIITSSRPPAETKLPTPSRPMQRTPGLGYSSRGGIPTYPFERRWVPEEDEHPGESMHECRILQVNCTKRDAAMATWNGA